MLCICLLTIALAYIRVSRSSNVVPPALLNIFWCDIVNGLTYRQLHSLSRLIQVGHRLTGNATFGLFDDQKQYLEFLKMAWHELIPNHSVWHVIDRGRIVN
jgi:hypothetical protein